MSTNNRITLQRTDSKNPDFPGLVVLMDEDLRRRYGPSQPNYDGFNLMGDQDAVVVAYLDKATAGCGCFRKFSDNTIEIKRMYVKSAVRGQRIATRILAELELWAKESGFSHAILETGKKQPEAIHLYERCGYAITINYGPYAGLDHTVCMRKRL